MKYIFKFFSKKPCLSFKILISFFYDELTYLYILLVILKNMDRLRKKNNVFNMPMLFLINLTLPYVLNIICTTFISHFTTNLNEYISFTVQFYCFFSLALKSYCFGQNDSLLLDTDTFTQFIQCFTNLFVRIHPLFAQNRVDTYSRQMMTVHLHQQPKAFDPN